MDTSMKRLIVLFALVTCLLSFNMQCCEEKQHEGTIVDENVPLVFSVAEYVKLEETPKNPVVLYYTNEDWKRLTKDIPKVDSDSIGEDLHFQLTAFPFGPGNTVIRPECVPEDCCHSVERITPDGWVLWQCICDYEKEGCTPPLRFTCMEIMLNENEIRCKGECEEGFACTLVKMTLYSYPHGALIGEAIACLCKNPQSSSNSLRP